MELRHACLAAACAAALGAAARTPDIPAVERRVVELANAFRAEEGLSPVTLEPRLEAAAREFARFMARTDRYGHTADGREPAARAKAAGYDYCRVSENLSYQYSSTGFATEELARRYVEGWKNSPGHRRNLLDDVVVHTAVAVARGEASGRYYAVQLFGRPASLAVRFQVRNDAGIPVRYRVGEEEYPLAARETATHRQCRSEPVNVVPARGEPVAPADGERLSIVREAGGVALRREAGRPRQAP